MPQLELNDFAPQIIWLVISFVTLYLIMARVALPRIANVLEERRDRIASDLDKAEQLKRKTDEAIAAYEESLAEARNSAHAIAQETRDKLSAEVDAEKAQVEKQIAEKTSKAEARTHESDRGKAGRRLPSWWPLPAWKFWWHFYRHMCSPSLPAFI